MQSAKTQPFTYYGGGDAIDLLCGQHREIDQLLGALVGARLPSDKDRLLAEVGDLLAVHMAIEERIFFPGLTAEENDGEDRTFVVLAVEDHFSVKRLLAELLRLDVAARSFDTTAGRLREQLRAHNDAEERLFPRIRRRLSRARLRRLEYEMRVLEFQIRTDAEPRHLVVEDDAPGASA
jgi:hemerythrin-like domain-containing protein